MSLKYGKLRELTMPSPLEQFWFQAKLVKVHGCTTTYVTRNGILVASDALKALDDVHEKYDGSPEGWSVNSVTLHLIDQDGEVVATTETGSRETHTCETKPKEVQQYEWSTVVSNRAFSAGIKELQR
jgi:hypothetical protein